MKKFILLPASLILFSFGGFSQVVKQVSNSQVVSSGKQKPGIATAWSAKSEAANAHARTALHHMLNIELPQAYAEFSEALKIDPGFTMAQAFMSNLSYGAQKKKFADAALKSSEQKTEGEKLFVKLLDEENRPGEHAAIWSKLFAMYPNERMVNSYYVYTRETPEERFEAAREMLKKYPDAGWMYNILGYYYMNDKKDMENAKASFDKYIAYYPDGYNPYDSMGEFYLVTGDTANAEKYYSMALEKYPFSNSAREALDGINARKKK